MEQKEKKIGKKKGKTEKVMNDTVSMVVDWRET